MNIGQHDPQIPSQRWWLRGLGLLWLIWFLWWFYSFTLPNGRFPDGASVSRSDVWILLPDLLAANFASNPSPDAAPSGWRFLTQRLDLIAVAAVILAGAWGLGHLVLRVVGIRERFDRPTRVVFAFALGLSGLSLMTLGFGLVGLLQQNVFVTILLLLVIGEIVCRIRGGGGASILATDGEGGVRTEGRQSGASRTAETQRSRAIWCRRRWDVVPAICLLTVAPFVLAMLLGAMLPSTDFDVKEYHLEGPKEFFQQGRVGFLPHNVYTSFPFLTEMLSLLAMVLRDDWFRGALAGKVVLMTMAPLTAIGLFAAGRRWFGSTVGWLCVVLYLTTPWVYRISIIAYAEGGLTFFLLATLLAVLWLSVEASGVEGDQFPGSHRSPVSTPQSPLPSTESPVLRSQSAATELADFPRTSRDDSNSGELPRWSFGHVLLCGLLAGSAVACKYPGLLSVAIPLGGLLIITGWRQWARAAKRLPPRQGNRSNRRAVVRQLVLITGLFGLGTLATFGPWMVKNVVETGNPVYPLLYGVFGGRDWDDAAHAKWQSGHPPMILGLLKEPQRIPGNFADRLVDVIARSDWQSPLLFGCAPLALCWDGRRRLVWTLWAYVGWLFLVWWTLTHHIDRFWIPMLPVVTLLAGSGLGWLMGTTANSPHVSTLRKHPLSTGIAVVATLLVGGAALFNLGYITTWMCGYNAYLIDHDAAKRDATTPSIAYLNEQLPDEARVLIVGGAEVFDARFDSLYNTVFDESLFERWTSSARPGLPPTEQPLRSAEEIRQSFREQGITHVFVDWNEVLRHRVPGGYGFTDYVSPARFEQLTAEQVLTPVGISARPWDGVDQNTRDEVERWGPALHRKVGETEALIQYELFEVR